MELLFWWVSEKIYDLFIRGCVLGFIGGAFTLTLVVFFQHKRLPLKPGGLIFSVAFLIGEMTVHPAAFHSFRSGSFLFHSLFVIAGVSFSLAIASFERRHNPFIICALILLSACAIFTTVPDTEELALLIGILLFATIAFCVPSARSRNWLGAIPFTIVLAWVIFIGGAGRPASIITSLGCLGFLILEPLLQLINRFSNRLLSFSAINEFAYHCLSITIALHLARTTSNMEQATIAAIAALCAPIIFILLTESMKLVKRSVRKEMWR